MIIILVLVLIAFPSVLLAPVDDDLIISLPNGQVQGTTYTSQNNKTYYGFQGIPYALPPIGDLRFEAPQPAQPWTEVWDGTKDSKACLSSLNLMYKDFESEDCLYLSVYVPLLKPVEKLPVMVWIYGGRFVVGSSRKSVHDPDFLIEEDLIIVQFNYRLGAFGFLSTGDSAIVGNAGLKDQALAIRWVHDNIGYFGGDPDKITIFGESAGGASTGLQLVSQKVAGLFRAAIVESGSALTNWSIDPNPKIYADLLTIQLGGEMYLNDTNQMKKFLLERSAQDLLNAANVLVFENDLISTYTDSLDYLPKNQPWPVREVESDDSFLTESPYEILSSGRFNKVPLIIGICANEAMNILNDLEIATATALWYDTVPNVIIPWDLRQNSSDEDTVIKTIHNAYLKEEDTFSNNLVALTNFFSDTTFTRGVIKHAELASKYIPVYLYQFSYYGRPRYPFILPGAEKAGHGAEMPFLFKQTESNTTDPGDLLTQNRMVKLWANFAKFLNPTPEESELINVTWPTTTATELQYLNINNTLEVWSHIGGERYKKWNNIYETYGQKPFVTF